MLLLLATEGAVGAEVAVMVGAGSMVVVVAAVAPVDGVG